MIISIQSVELVQGTRLAFPEFTVRGTLGSQPFHYIIALDLYGPDIQWDHVSGPELPEDEMVDDLVHNAIGNSFAFKIAVLLAEEYED